MRYCVDSPSGHVVATLQEAREVAKRLAASEGESVIHCLAPLDPPGPSGVRWELVGTVRVQRNHRGGLTTEHLGRIE